MEEKNNKVLLEEYIKKLFNTYINHSYSDFYNIALNYNIKIGDYNIDIEKQSKNLLNKIISLINNNNAVISYKEFNNFFKLNVKFNENNNFYQPIIDIPVFLDNYEKICIEITKYLISNKYNFNYRFRKKYRNSILELRVDNINVALEITKLFENNDILKNTIKSRVLPFLLQKNLLGFSMEYKPYNLKNYFLRTLVDYFSYNYDINDINTVNLEEFLLRNYESEQDLNKKRMNLVLYKMIYIINNNEDITELYKFDSNLDIGSFDHSLYELKLDENGIIYYKSKIDDMYIYYGSEDYLNLSYSKFYDNVMKKEKNEVYYNYFYSIFSKLLSNNYKNIENILSFKDNNFDKTYKKLLLFSCCFFAYRKMNFSIEFIYTILDYVLKKNEKIVVNKDLNYEFDEEKNEKNNFSLDINYANKVIDEKNGDKITIKEYFRKYKIFDYINNNSIVYLKNGTTISGEEFLNNLYLYINKYDNFFDLINDLISIIEYK